MASLFYASFPENLGGGNTAGEGPMDMLSDQLDFLLTTSTYTPNQTTHTIKSDVTNEVANGSGYTTGGKTLSNKVYAASSLVTKLDADDLTWTGASFTHRNGVLFDNTPTSPADPLIGYITNGSDVSPGGNDLVYQWNASGIFTLTVA